MIEAVKFWNEPNNKSHWIFECDPDWRIFGDMVKLAAKAVKAEKPDAKMLSMVEQIIADRTTKWSDTMLRDPVQDRLLEIIKSKQAPKRKAKAKKDDAEAPAPQSNVIDLMAALKKSLEGKPETEKKSGR